MTTDRTDAVLAEIDGALTAYGSVDRDWLTGPDAMRWTPDRPEKPQYPLSLAGGEVTIRFDATELLAGMDALRQAFERIGAAMARATCETASFAAAAFGYSWADGKIHYHAADASRRVLRRCQECNPRGFQPPCPDGEYYRRRQMARRRRSRRR